MIKSSLTDPNDIAVDLTWIDMLKGIAIIGVFLDNWTIYNHINFPVWGPFVQVFFILSGFGLMLAYLKRKAHWNWKQWAWRRITKIVVPYILIVIFSFMLGELRSSLYPSINMQFSWTSLLAYLTFTQNFYPPSWVWNPPLWFMPIIIGLYFCFPGLIRIFEKWGVGALLLISVFITYGTLTAAILTGTYKGHSADVFSFWLIQFSLGMALAWIKISQPQKLRNLIGLKAFLVGVGLFLFSWVLRTYVPLGKAYNDLFTSVSIFLILLNLGWISRLLFPLTGRILKGLGSKSYLMYLIHFPIMVFLIGPPLRGSITNPIIGIILGGVYIGAIFLLCYFLSQPIDRLSSWLYQLFYPAYRHKAVAPTAGK